MVVALTAPGVPPVRAIGCVQVTLGVPRARQGKVGEGEFSEALATDVLRCVSLGGPQDAADSVFQTEALSLSYRVVIRTMRLCFVNMYRASL